jgi:hypothetical protein
MCWFRSSLFIAVLLGFDATPSSIAYGSSPGSEFALKAYEIWNHKKCPQTSIQDLKMETAALQKTCPQVAAPDLHLSAQGFEDKLFFNVAAELQVQENSCRLSHLKDLQNSKTVTPLEQTAIKNIADHLREMRPLYKQIQADNQKLFSLEQELSSNANHSSPEISENLIQQMNQLRPKILEESQKFARVYETLWACHDPQMKAYIERVLQSDLTPEEFTRQALEIKSHSLVTLPGRRGFSFRGEAVDTMADETQKDQDRLMHFASLENGKFTFNFSLDALDSVKQNLVRQGSALTQLQRSTNSDLQGLACRLDGRYGEGPKDLDVALNTGLLIGGLFTGGLTELSMMGRAGVAAAEGASETLSSEKLSRLVYMSFSMGSSAQAAEQVIKHCAEDLYLVPKHRIVTPANGQSQCQPTSDWAQSEIRDMQDGNCALSMLQIYGQRIIGARIKTGVKTQAVSLLEKRAERAAANKTEWDALAEANPKMKKTVDRISFWRLFRLGEKSAENYKVVSEIQDPQVRKTAKEIMDRFSNSKPVYDYQKEWAKEAALAVSKSKNPEVQKALAQGKIPYSALLKILRKRAADRGEPEILKVPKGSEDEDFYEISKKGPFIDKAASGFSGHGEITHLIQRDMVADIVAKEYPGQPNAFYEKLSPEQWNAIFDQQYIRNAGKPEFLNQFMLENMPGYKPN